jgi:hypothetical protein
MFGSIKLIYFHLTWVPLSYVWRESISARTLKTIGCDEVECMLPKDVLGAYNQHIEIPDAETWIEFLMEK